MKTKNSRRRKANTEADLTRRNLRKFARKSFTEAARETMDVMGYTVIARDGWVIKLFPDGQFEKISKIKKVNQLPGLARN
jgi:phosphorylcholine metabolism protein LicD